MGISGKLTSCLKEVQPLVVYDIKRGMSLEPMQGKRASTPIDLRYTEIFPVLAVKSVSF